MNVDRAFEIMLASIVDGKADVDRVARLERAIEEQYPGLERGIGPEVVAMKQGAADVRGTKSGGGWSFSLIGLIAEARRGNPFVWLIVAPALVVVLLAFGVTVGLIVGAFDLVQLACVFSDAPSCLPAGTAPAGTAPAGGGAP